MHKQNRKNTTLALASLCHWRGRADFAIVKRPGKTGVSWPVFHVEHRPGLLADMS